MAFEDWADLFTSVALCSTERAFAKARADGAGGGSFGFAASRAGRGKQAGDFGRVKRPHKKDKRLAKRRDVIEAVTAAAAAERPAEQLVELEVAAAAASGTAGTATTEGDAESGGAQVERENARRRRGGDGAQVEPAAAPKKRAAPCAVL